MFEKELEMHVLKARLEILGLVCISVSSSVASPRESSTCAAKAVPARGERPKPQA